MTDIFADSFPWSDEDKREAAASSAETTPGGSEPTKWVVVTTGLNPGEVNIIAGRLESEGITALVQQEAMGSGQYSSSPEDGNTLDMDPSAKEKTPPMSDALQYNLT